MLFCLHIVLYYINLQSKIKTTYVMSIVCIHVYMFIIPPPQNVGGGLYWICFVASVGPSVRQSVRLQFVSALYLFY